MKKESSPSAAGPSADPSAKRPVPRLARRSLGLRLCSLALAVVAAVFCLGSQIGLVALYSGDAEALLAKLRSPTATGLVVAGAPDVQRHDGSSPVEDSPATDVPTVDEVTEP